MQADALTWGQGPRILEVFLEPTCPFSVKAFRKLDKLLEQAGEDRLTIKIRLQSQPWHMFSGVIVRCILAASTLEGGKNKAKAVMAAVAAHRAEFEFEHHASGPNLDATPNDIIARLEGYSGVQLVDPRAGRRMILRAADFGVHARTVITRRFRRVRAAARFSPENSSSLR